VIRGFAPTIALIAMVAPTIAHAQVNLDAGKSAAQLFAAGCVECHKAPHGLSHGKSSAALTDFLLEHYTTNRSQAAALAAYVLGVRGESAGTDQGRAQRRPPEHANGGAEEPKPKRSPEHANAAAEDAKRKKHERTHATGKPQRPAHEAARPADDASQDEQPSIMAPEPRPTTATVSRSHRKDHKSLPAEAPAAVVHDVPAAAAPDAAPAESPIKDAAPTPTAAAAPAEAVPASTPPAEASPHESGENAPVPRDHIPD